MRPSSCLYRTLYCAAVTLVILSTISITITPAALVRTKNHHHLAANPSFYLVKLVVGYVPDREAVIIAALLAAVE